METSLTLDNKQRNLNVLFKQRFEHSSDVQLKVKGVLNTVTAGGQFWGKLNKFLRLGDLKYNSSDAFRPDTRLRLGLGAKASSVTEDVFLSVNGKKKFTIQSQQAVQKGLPILKNYTQLTLAATYDYNMRNEIWGGEAHASVSHAIFKFVDNQDVRVTVGVRGRINQTGLADYEPYLRVQENCWSILTNLKGDWRLTYDL